MTAAWAATSSVIWLEADPVQLWLFPILFGTGLLVQLAGFWKKNRPLFFAGVALLVLGAAFDRDIVLAVGQILIAILLFLERDWRR
jgi:hypothetical protein